MAGKASRSDHEASGQALRARLRAAGLRATPARLAVYRALRLAARPVSHADVCAAIEGGRYDRTTVYRNLVDLTEAGLARRADLGDHVWRFEGFRGDEDRAMHPHFVCSECGTVTCLPEDAVQVAGDRKALPKAAQAGAADIQIRGTCDDCS